MTEEKTETRTAIIAAVKTPLGFLVLGLLLIETILAGLALQLDEYREPLVWSLIISIPSLMLVVLITALWRPEALRGDRPLQDIHAKHFATTLFLGLDGALSNLERLEREEAWLTLADVLGSEDSNDQTYKNFSVAVSVKLRLLAGLNNRTVRTVGPIPNADPS